MAVLVEGIAVVVRCSSILKKYAGGESSFMSDLPNQSLCADGELAAVFLMTPADAKSYVELLEKRGLKYFDGTKAVDIVVADQRTGLRAPCDWAYFGTTNWNNQDGCVISVCQAEPRSFGKVVVPKNWIYEKSLSAQGVYMSPDNIPSTLKLRRREPGVDVFFDEATGKEFYVRHP